MEDFSNTLGLSFNNFWIGFVEYLPNLVAMFIIVIGGLLFAWLFKILLLRFFKIVNFDTWSDRVGLTTIIRKGDIWTKPSLVFGKIFYWLLIIIFLMIGLGALQIKTINDLTVEFLIYLPRAFSALLILIIGYIVAGFLTKGILIAAVNAGYHYARVLAEAVRLLLIVLLLAMALEQLRISPGIVIAAFSIIFGGIVLALAIAFGIGGIDAAKKIIERQEGEKKAEKDREIEHI